MRFIICWIPLLCACSTPAVRCDAQLQPINAPAVGAAAGASPAVKPAGAASATARVGAAALAAPAAPAGRAH